MRIGSYQFQCEFTAPAFLPEFKGSAIRGVFGHSLKKTVCALRRQACGGCLLEGTCCYSFVFEPHRSDGKNSAHRPHPYIITHPQDPRRQYRPGEPFEFALTLFGSANDYLPHIVCSVEEMGRCGFGRFNSRGAGTFLLRAVLRNGAEIYGDGKILARQPLTEHALSADRGPDARRLTVRFLTPVRLKFNNHFQESLDFHVVARAALRRISTLENAYGDGEPQLDYRGLILIADNIAVINSDRSWEEIERYSNRQKTGMKMGGVRGSVTYSGDDLPEFVNILRYCEVVNIGKQTSFGLGRISVEVDL